MPYLPEIEANLQTILRLPRDRPDLDSRGFCLALMEILHPTGGSPDERFFPGDQVKIVGASRPPEGAEVDQPHGGIVATDPMRSGTWVCRVTTPSSSEAYAGLHPRHGVMFGSLDGHRGLAAGPGVTHTAIYSVDGEVLSGPYEHDPRIVTMVGVGGPGTPASIITINTITGVMVREGVPTRGTLWLTGPIRDSAVVSTRFRLGGGEPEPEPKPKLAPEDVPKVLALASRAPTKAPRKATRADLGVRKVKRPPPPWKY